MANVYKTDSSTGEISKYVFNPSTGSGSYVVMTPEEIAKRDEALNIVKESKRPVMRNPNDAFTGERSYVYGTPKDTSESSIGTDIKRVALSTLEAPFELASDLLVRPFSADKEKYDASTAEKFKNVKTGLLGLIGDDTEEEVAEIIDPRTGDTRTPDTFTGQVLDIGTYLVGGGLLFKGLGKVTKLGKATRGVIAEQATEQLLTDPDYNMANLVQDLKKEPNAVVDYLAADKNDDVLLNRAKLVLTSGLFAGSLAGIYKLGFSAVNVEKSSRKLFGKPAKELTDEQLPEVMGELLSQQKRKGNSKIVKAVKRAAEDDEKGIAQVIDQSTNSISGKLKWFKQRWMQSRGFLSKKGFEAQQEGIASQKELISKAGHIAYRLQSFIDNVGTTAKSETLTNKIAAALETGNTKGLSKEVAAEVNSARNLIDDLSSTILDNNIGGEVLRRSIEKNMGQYVRKSYRLFEDKNFVPDAALYEDAVDALVASRTKGKKEISVKALKKYEADARSSLDSLLERGEKQSFNDYVAKMQQIKKGYFKGRKDIDPAVRKLMGEIESPTENIILTAQKLGSITENHKFYNTLENLGGSTPASPTLFNSAVKTAREELRDVDVEDVQKTFKEGTYVTDLDDSLGKIIKVNKNGSYKVAFKDSITGKKKTRTVASSDEMDLVSPDKAVSRRATEIYEDSGGSFTKEKYIFEGKNGVFDTQIQGTGSSLDGKFTTKDMARAVNNLEDTHLLWGAFSKGLKNQEVIRYFSGVKGFNQQMRTVYDHTTHLRNALGGFQFGLANGLNPISRGRTNFNVLHNEVTKGGNKVFDNFYEKLQGLGIINTSVRAGEARALLNIAAESNPARFASRLGKHSKKYSGANTAHKYFVKRPEDIYMATDDFFKMNAFVNELEVLKKARPRASLDVLEKEAAEIIKQTFPNYDRVFKGVKALRELPVGNFVSFPAEILRTGFNITRQGFKEITSGNKALMARGTKRLTGFATTNLGYYAVGAAGWSTLGLNKRENEALNTLNEGFSDSNKSYARIGDDMLVQDNNHIMAYAALMEPVMEALRKTNKGIELGESDAVALRQGVLSGMRILTKPFTDEAMLTTALWDLGSALKSDRNATSKGKQLWTDDSNMVEGMFTHVINSFAPGVFLDVKKLREAINEVPNPTTGLKRSIPARLLEFGTGLNFRKFTPQNQFTYKVRDYIGDVNFKTTKAKVKFDKEGSDFFEEYTIEQSRRFKASQELYRHIGAMADLGYDNRVISNILKDNGVSSFNERLSLLQGKFVPREISADDKFNIRTKMGGDSKVFETLDSLRAYTDFIAGTSLEPDSDFQKRKSKIIRKKISLDDFQKQKYATGGEVDVPNAPDEPDERIDKYTGLPYNMQAGEAYMDKEDPLRRLGFMGGGAVQDPLVRLGFAQGSEVQTFGIGDIRPELQVEAIEPVEIPESLEQKIQRGEPETRQILKEVNKGLPYTPKPADKDFLKSAVKTLEQRFANEITTPETILRLGSSAVTNVTSPITNAVSAVADATGVTDAIGSAVEKATDTNVYKEYKAKFDKWVQENPEDAKSAERILEDLGAVINIFGTGYGVKTLFGGATKAVNKSAAAMPTKIEGFYGNTGNKALNAINQFRATAKVGTKALVINTLDTLKRLTGKPTSELAASKKLAIQEAANSQRIVDKNFQTKSLFDPKGVPKFTTKDGKPITEIPPLGTPLFDVKGLPVIKANALEHSVSEIITTTLIKDQAGLKPLGRRPTNQQYISDRVIATENVSEILTTKYKHPDLPTATAAEQATLMKHLKAVGEIDPTTIINVLRGDSLQKITPTIFKSNQIGASSLQKKMFGNKERQQWAEFIKNTDPATGLPINEKGFISLLNKARLNKLNSSEIDSIISNASPAQVGGWLEFKLATPKDIRAVDVLSKFVKREPLPIPDPKRTGKKGFKVTYRDKDGNPTTDKNKATNITLQDSNDIGAQELGGVNLYFNLNLNDGIARITLSDKHDIFGMKPLSGKNLVNVSAEHGWSYRNLTKYPPTSVRNIAEESQTALKLLKDNGATIKDGNLIFKQNKKTVSVPLIGKMEGASMEDLTNLANGKPSKFKNLAVSVDTTLLGYKGD